jgi:hypothetical protein
LLMIRLFSIPVDSKRPVAIRKAYFEAGKTMKIVTEYN